MENFRLILYILIGVIYVFYRLTRKSKAPIPQKTTVTPSANTPSKSYNTAENKIDTIYSAKPLTKSSAIAKEAKEKLSTAIAPKRSHLSVEKTGIPVENYEHKPVEKLVDKPVNKNVEKKEFNPYNLEQASLNPYAQFLNTPEGIKAAFIASEIMQRKYE